MGAVIGARIKRLRLERGLALRQIAGPGCSYAYVSRIERGQRTPSGKALQLIAKKLGVTPLFLQTGSDAARCPYCGREGGQNGDKR